MTDPTAAAREKAREIVWHTTINAPVGSPKWYGEFWEVLAKELAAAERRGRDAAVPAGWRLVPVEPTEAMHDAARDWSYGKYGKPIGTDASAGCWAAMLAAAPHKGADDGR